MLALTAVVVFACNATAAYPSQGQVDPKVAASLFVPGTPIQRFDTPVLISSCGLRIKKPIGDANQTVTYEYSIYNTTRNQLHLVAFTDRFDFASFQEAFVYDLKPHEFRRVAMQRRADPSSIEGVLLGKHRPTFFLCGSGPEQDSNGKILPYASLQLKSLQVTRLLVPTIDGEFRSPFDTIASEVLSPGSTFVPGAPIQTKAADQESTFQANTPPRNAVPYVLAGCFLEIVRGGLIFHATVASQAFQSIKTVSVSFEQNRAGPRITFHASNIDPFNVKTFAWRAPRSRYPLAANSTDPAFCGIGPGLTADGVQLKYRSLDDWSPAASRP